MAQKADLTKLWKLQDRCVSTINLHSNIEATYNKHGILTLDEIVKLENSKLWYKYYHGLLPEKLQRVMSSGPSCESLLKKHEYNTRRKRELNSPKASNLEYRKSFLFKGLNDYSELPPLLKNAKSPHCFVPQIKSHLHGSWLDSQADNWWLTCLQTILTNMNTCLA